MNKIIFSNFLPGSFVSGILQVITEDNFLRTIIDFAIRITQFVEKALHSGKQPPIFRLSYLKVMWKDVSETIMVLFQARFLPMHDIHMAKFLIEFIGQT
jgi:hypothetical protein